MNDLRNLVEQYLRAAWRRRWLGVAVAWLGCLVGWAGVYTIPNQFQSSARLYVDADAILTPLLHGIAAESAPEAQLELLQRTLLSRPNMDKLISKTDLDLTVHSIADRERLIDSLQRTIHVTPQSRNLFTIAYRNTDPKRAYNVVQTLLTIFVESATGTNRSDMDNARRFLQNQIASYQKQLRTVEDRRAAFRARYADILPESGSNLPALDAAKQRLEAIEGQLQDANSERNLLRQELANTPAMVHISVINRQQDQIKLQQAEEELQMLLLKDTAQHPAVIAQKKLIAALRAQAAAASTKNPSGSASSVSGADTGGALTPNPIYDQLKLKLVDADTKVIALERQHDVAVRALKHLQEILKEQPGLLVEYRNLDRNYGVLRQMYQDLLSRLQAANIAQAADTEADKVKILVVDPPQLSHVPVAPNRSLLVSLVLVLAIGAGIGTPILVGQFDSSFSSADDLRNIGLPVLGGISVLGIAPLRQRLMVVARLGIALGFLIVLYGGLMLHLLHGAGLT